MVTENKGRNDSSTTGSRQAPNPGIHSGVYQQLGNNALLMNPHAVAQAATAALAVAAQQVAQQATSTQQGITFTSNHLINNQNNNNTNNATSTNNTITNQKPTKQGSRTTPQNNNSIPPSKLNGNMTSLQETIPLTPILQNAPTFPNNSQQIAINAQAAALLAAGSINPTLLLNSGNLSPAHATTIAAAQAFTTLIQSQQQQGPQQQTGSAAATQYQDQQNSLSAQSADTLKPSPNPLIQHFNHSVPAQSAILNGRNQHIKKMTNGNDSLSLPRGGKANQNMSSVLQIVNTPVTQSAQHQPQNSVNTVYAAAANNPIFFAQMQNWKLEQLEAHCHLLQETNQPIPQQVSLLLADARRREEKRTAKRVANRKSACTSRARKKAFVEEMTRTNARLKRQAIILSLLPDLVIAIKLNGEITFCSDQVSRVLRHSVDTLVGASINDILIPSSQKELHCLIKKLAAAEKAALDENNKEGDESGRSSNSENQSTTAVVSEQSDQGFPPLSVVKVNSCSSVTSAYQSPSEIPRTSHTDDVTGALVTANNAGARLSSLQHKPEKKHTDDVTGASVTANNAEARLSSLQHKPSNSKTLKVNDPNFEGQEDVSSSTSSDSLFAGVEDKRKKINENVSDDSGYRESNESLSREDTSSTSDTSNGGKNLARPLAPACNVCLIRNDLSTIWCEVTSSIRTRCINEENSVGVATVGSGPLDKKRVNACNSNESLPDDEQVKELLLCLRPIRDGDNKVGRKLRFIPTIKNGKEVTDQNDAKSSKKIEINKAGPMKKRPLPELDLQKNQKKATLEKSGSEAEKSVVESLILMSSHKRQTS